MGLVETRRVEEEGPSSVLEIFSQPEQEPDESGIRAHVAAKTCQQAPLVPEWALPSGARLLDVHCSQKMTGGWSHGSIFGREACWVIGERPGLSSVVRRSCRPLPRAVRGGTRGLHRVVRAAARGDP